MCAFLLSICTSEKTWLPHLRPLSLATRRPSDALYPLPHCLPHGRRLRGGGQRRHHPSHDDLQQPRRHQEERPAHLTGQRGLVLPLCQRWASTAPPPLPPPPKGFLLPQLSYIIGKLQSYRTIGRFIPLGCFCTYFKPKNTYPVSLLFPQILQLMFAIDIYDINKNCSVFSITNTLAMSVTPFNLIRQR